MPVSERWNEFKRLFRAALALLELPRARLHFYSAIAPGKIRQIFKQFNKPHARIPMIKNKTLGIALIDLSNFNSPEDYIATVKKRDFAAYHARHARKRGYTVRRINRNEHAHDIHDIHLSSETRQGRPMDSDYLVMQTDFDESEPMQCFGVFNSDGKLCGYCRFGIYGDFAATDRLIGIKSSDGIMYLLLLDIICALIQEKNLKYFMYDTFLGAQPGLQSFKRRVGFQPYRVSYAID
jgi:hypothetical protein